MGLGAVVLVAAMAATALANGGPVAPAIQLQSAGGSLSPVPVLEPADSTGVAVVSENLLLDLSGSLRDSANRALVRANYHLLNEGTGAERVTVAFPLPVESASSAAVWLDGQRLPAAPATVPVALGSGDILVSDAWLDPYTREAYGTAETWRPKDPVFITFAVAFAPGQRRVLEVEYRQAPSLERARFVRPVLRYDYLLQPARHWADFGSLTLEVRGPSGRLVRSNLPLFERTGSDQYAAVYDGLPPNNLSLFVAPGYGGPFRFWSWWWQGGTRALMLAVLAIIGGLAAGLLRRSGDDRLSAAGLSLRYMLLVALPLLTGQSLSGPGAAGVMATWVLLAPGLLGLVLLAESFTRVGAVQPHWSAPR